MRAFIALPMPEALERAVLHCIERERGLTPGASWLGPGRLHVSLRFLGELSDVQGASAAMDRAAAGHPPFELTVEGAGTFGGVKRPHVLWLGLGGDVNALKALYGSLTDALVPVGFPPEERAFHPHLTLARARGRSGDPELGHATERLKGVDLGALPVTELVLFQSELSPKGARHTPVHRAPLGAVSFP